jgi:hypothetical protein
MKNVTVSLFVLISLLISTKGFCQPEDNDDLTDIVKVTFFNPGISYEKRIAKLQSLYAQLFMNTSFAVGYSSSFGTTANIQFDPAFTLQYRYYYNAKQRAANGKHTEMNNLNYVSFISEITVVSQKLLFVDHVEKKYPAVNIFGIAWGLQRNYKQRFSLDLAIGGGYFFAKVAKETGSGQFQTQNAGDFTLITQLNLGFWLNKRNIN